jgi:hypothetical protein
LRRFCTILAVGLAVAGCSEADPRPGALGYPLPECPELDVDPCDTRAPECRQRLLELAACVYGVDSAPDVPIRVVTEAQLIDELEAADGEQDDADDAAELEHLERALVDLQLLVPGALTEGHGRIEDLVDRVDGVYRDAEHGIALVDRGMPKNDAESNAVLVHELVHAIQDALYDLKAWQARYDDEPDTLLALRSVSEGQATYAQFRVVFAMLGYDLSRFDLAGPIDDFRSRLMRSAHADPSPYTASVTTFPYAAGVSPAARGWRASGPHFSAARFEAPPLTTWRALSDSYALALPEPEPIQLTAPGPDPDFVAVGSSALGAFMLELFLGSHGFDAETARSLALDWRADRLWVYAGPEQRTGFLWQVELQTTDWGRSLDDARPLPAGVVREHRGRRLFVAGSATPPEFLLTAGRRFVDAPG